MSDKNKVRFNLKNVHVGTLTFENNVPTFGVPKPYPGAVHLTMNPEGESTPFFADGVAYYNSTSNNGYAGDLEMAYLYDWFEKEYLGSKQSKEGMIVEMADVDPVPFYLMFQFDGDANATKHIFFNVQANRPTLEGQTNENSKTPMTTTIPITAVPLDTEKGPIVKAKCPPLASNYDTFFKTAPVLPTFEDVAPANVEGGGK